MGASGIKNMTKLRHLYLLRHAKSSWDDSELGDFERPLAPRGRIAAKTMGRQLRELGVDPQLILCSTARRTRETLDAMGEAVKHIPVSFEEDMYEASTPQLLTLARGLGDQLHRVMFIGHNPGFAAIAQLLCDGRGATKSVTRLGEKFPTGAIAVMETDAAHWADLGKGSCRLADFIRPADVDE